MKKICVQLNFLTPADEAILSNCAKENGMEIAFFAQNQLEEASAYLQSCEAFIGHNLELLRNAPATLQWCACPNAGVEVYCDDPTLFKNPDAVLTNSAGAYGVTIGEHLVMQALMLMRNMKDFYADAAAHRWGKTAPMRSIRGSRVTVVGAGDIGCAFAANVKGMGASHITGLSRSGKARSADFDTMGTLADLDSVLPESDIVMLALPNTAETVHIINAQRLALMKPSAYLLNVGRGSAIDQEALAHALNTGLLAGAAIDVCVPEPLPQNHPLWDVENLIITPHVAGDMSLGYTVEKTVAMFCENIALFAQGKPLNHAVDRVKGY